LRSRVNDIPLLINAFLEKYQQYRSGPRIAPETLERLTAYRWPGNVRELKSIIQSAVNLAQGRRIDTLHLPGHLRDLPKPRHPQTVLPENTEIAPLAAIEKKHILFVYEQFEGNKTRTAKALAIGLNTLRRKLAAYGVD
jgi:DNA-binding NtrC family response regulator